MRIPIVRIRSGAARQRRTVLVLLTAWVVAGCTPYDDGRVVALNDEMSRGGWSVEAPGTVCVPGDLIRSWTHPKGGRLVYYRSLPVPKANADAIANELANRISNLPGARVLRTNVALDGARRWARVDAVAPGDGRSWAPSGLGTPIGAAGSLVETHMSAAGMPGESATYWLTAYWPAADASELGAATERIIERWARGVTSPTK